MTRKERLLAKQKRDGEKRGGNSFRVLDTKDYGEIEWVKAELDKEYYFDFLPYVVTTHKHPEYETLKEDDLLEDYKLDLFIHKGIGPTKKNVVCPNRTYGKKCPICEEHDRIRNSEEFKDLDWNDKKLKDAVGHLRPSQKSFFVVVDLNDDDKIKLFEYSHYWFTKNLLNAIKKKSKRQQILLQDFTDEGFSVAFEFDESTFDDKKPGPVTQFEFEQREKGAGYTEEDVDDAPKLDAMVKLLKYSEIESIFYGEDDDSDSKEDDDDDEKEEVEETPKSSRRSSRRAEKESEPEEDDDEPEESPRERRRRERAERKAQEEADEDDAPSCPEGLKFGHQVDSKKCIGEDCELYSQCDAEYDRLEKAGKLED